MASTNPIACSFALSTPPPSGLGAIAIIDLLGDIDAALHAMGFDPVPTSAVRRRQWRGVDDLVVARLSDRHALLFPHAGPAVLARVLSALARIGLSPARATTVRARYPEAPDELQARMLDALARAQSPLAIDLLLDQPTRWSLAATGVLSHEDSRILRRLITPPLVVALGPPNIGKSSLLNALAGRQVALVADEPGTTRDHVGVHLNLGGLVVRYLDAPGIDLDHSGILPSLAEAQHAALHVAQSADLILLCADAGSSFLPAPVEPSIRVGLRCDLGHPREGAEIQTSVRDHLGLAELTTRIRDTLVPPALLADQRAWVFWDD